MSKRTDKRTLPPAARVFGSLQADDALLPGEASALRRSGALFLALLVLAATPLYLAANAARLIGDTPAARATTMTATAAARAAAVTTMTTTPPPIPAPAPTGPKGPTTPAPTATPPVARPTTTTPT